jgi:hypothetical protein
MRRLFLIAAAVVLASAAHAMTFSKVQLCQILQPCEVPQRFASGPFREKPVVRKVSLRDIQTICGGRRPFPGNRDRAAAADADVPGLLGCAQFVGGACVVHVPGDLEAAVPELYRLIVDHELAHCRGWVHRRY